VCESDVDRAFPGAGTTKQLHDLGAIATRGRRDPSDQATLFRSRGATKTTPRPCLWYFAPASEEIGSCGRAVVAPWHFGRETLLREKIDRELRPINQPWTQIPLRTLLRTPPPQTWPIMPPYRPVHGVTQPLCTRPGTRLAKLSQSGKIISKNAPHVSLLVMDHV
jgi:hypothetical protein